jgi:ABC-type glutathione transport system ATPase component
MSALLEVRDLVVRYPVERDLLGRPRRFLVAVDRVSLDLAAGETLGLVGASGCGKSTLGRALLRLVAVAGGTVRFDGADVLAARGAAAKALCREMQPLFQDPWSSLDPRQRVGDAVAEGLRLHDLLRGAPLRRRVDELLEQVGLAPALASALPQELSGGQRQRVGIARALAVEPRFLVCDEPVSALDLSVQAQVVNLLLELRERRGLSYLFISHDLALVAAVSHRVVAMEAGRLVERAAAASP